MTPGEAALIEAMRVEQARIYGALQPEHHSEDDVTYPAGLSCPRATVIRLAPPRDSEVA